LDTPVKRYSSGMYVRLAFAVAAHLEPEILLVDEVLAVGDAAFQSKCIGKMEGVAREGRTVLFVSHDMAAMEALCTRCFLLVDGRLTVSGDSRQVAARDLTTSCRQETGRCNLDPATRKRQRYSAAAMTEVAVSSGDAIPASGIPMGSDLAVHVTFRAEEPIHPVLGVVVKTPLGFSLFGINNRIAYAKPLPKIQGEAVITCQFDRPALMPGKYYLDLYLGDPAQELDVVKDAISFEVFPKDVFGTGKLPNPLAGPMIVQARWGVEETTIQYPTTVNAGR